MQRVRKYVSRLAAHCLVLCSLALCWLTICADSATAAEPNNTPVTATILPGGTLVVNDSLNGAPGRPNTLLGIFDPSFANLQLLDDNSSPLGNGFASQLTGIPLRSDGSLYFQVTGMTDVAFAGNHTQSGKYAWYLDVRDPQGNIVPSLSKWQNDELSPFNQDTEWLDPSVSPDPGNPNWEGYTADLTLNNVVGPGSGDALDFWVFTGLQPFQEFTATFSGAFAGLIAQYGPTNTRIAETTAFDAIPTLTGMADFMGRVKLGVTGVGDSGFTGAHVAAGDYRLALTVVPEPGSVILAGLGAAGVWFCFRRQKHSRRRSNSIC